MCCGLFAEGTITLQCENFSGNRLSSRGSSRSRRQGFETGMLCRKVLCRCVGCWASCSSSLFSGDQARSSACVEFTSARTLCWHEAGQPRGLARCNGHSLASSRSVCLRCSPQDLKSRSRMFTFGCALTVRSTLYSTTTGGCWILAYGLWLYRCRLF